MRCSVILSLFTVGLIFDHSLVTASDWPAWRGPTGDNKAADNATPPVEWSKTKNVRWKTAIPGEGHSSPIVVGDQVIMGLAERNEQMQGLVALNRHTGKVNWSQVSRRGWFPSLHPKNTHASQTVASDGERLFVNFYADKSIYLYCYDLDGKKLWDITAGPYVPTKYQFGYGSNPCLHGDLVIVAGEHDGPGGSWMRAFNKTTGKQVWSTRRPQTLTFGSPVIGSPGGRETILVAGGTTIDGFDPATGDALWSVGGFATAACGTPVWEGDLVFASGGYPEQITMAVDVTTKQAVWQNSVKAYEQSLLVHEGVLYGVNEQGVLHAWDAKTGKQHYRQRQGGDQCASPILAGGNIYTTNEVGATWVFKPGTKYEEVARNDLGRETFATLTPVDDVLFYRVGSLGGGSMLYCLGE